MNIDIKKSTKPVKYIDAIEILEKRVIDVSLKKRKKDIRKFISLIEKTIIDTLMTYNIKTFSDKKNIGIWHKKNLKIEKVAAIGVRVSKWIAYHGFSININNDITNYKKIIPCGIKDKSVTTLKNINNQNYNNLCSISLIASSYLTGFWDFLISIFI